MQLKYAYLRFVKYLFVQAIVYLALCVQVDRWLHGTQEDGELRTREDIRDRNK